MTLFAPADLGKYDIAKTGLYETVKELWELVESNETAFATLRTAGIGDEARLKALNQLSKLRKKWQTIASFPEDHFLNQVEADANAALSRLAARVYDTN